MMKLSKARYLFGVTILLWAVMVFVYIVPIEDSRRNICAAFAFVVGLTIIYCVRAFWRWLIGHKDPWGNED
jgi:hypothetical protein